MDPGSGDGSNGPRTRPGPFDVDAYLDAADRLERAMDTQIRIIEGIDDKAEHVTRLIALLIGVIFSVVSLLTRLSQAPSTPPPFMVLLAFGMGVGGLLVSMGAGVITYLGSRYRIGLHHDVGEILSDPSYATDMPEHVRNVLGSYAFVIGQNRRVVESNVYWFRLTLLFLLYGMSFVALSGFLYVGGFESPVPRNAVVGASLLSLGVGYYVLSGSFLPLQDGDETDE